jgi:hypothetical protein
MINRASPQVDTPRTDRAPIPQSPAKALLLRDYTANRVLLIGLIAGVTLVSYAARVARDF